MAKHTSQAGKTQGICASGRIPPPAYPSWFIAARNSLLVFVSLSLSSRSSMPSTGFSCERTFRRSQTFESSSFSSRSSSVRDPEGRAPAGEGRALEGLAPPESPLAAESRGGHGAPAGQAQADEDQQGVPGRDEPARVGWRRDPASSAHSLSFSRLTAILFHSQ